MVRGRSAPSGRLCARLLSSQRYAICVSGAMAIPMSTANQRRCVWRRPHRTADRSARQPRGRFRVVLSPGQPASSRSSLRETSTRVDRRYERLAADRVGRRGRSSSAHTALAPLPHQPSTIEWHRSWSTSVGRGKFVRMSAEGGVRKVRLFLRTSRVPFEPLVDPHCLQTNRSSSTNARVMEFATLASGVDRVTADAGILRTLGNGQPNLHRPSARARTSAGVKLLWGVARSSAPASGRRAALNARMRQCADIEPRGAMLCAVWARSQRTYSSHSTRVDDSGP